MKRMSVGTRRALKGFKREWFGKAKKQYLTTLNNGIFNESVDESSHYSLMYNVILKDTLGFIKKSVRVRCVQRHRAKALLLPRQSSDIR